MIFYRWKMKSKSFAPSDKFKIFKVQLNLKFSKDFKVLKIQRLIYILSYFDIANFNNNSSNNSSTAATSIFNHFK